ncbi:MAG: replication-associated recombination protein A [Myxococcales bacterium]
MDLFDRAAERDGAAAAPLAERVRPTALEDVLGQADLLGEGRLLRKAIARDELPSLILWGPPGSGKTTLARVIARTTRAEFVPFSAVLGGVKEIREIVLAAERSFAERRTRTVLFVDEIHRFNKGQQDAFLPHLEKGTLTLIGATTENPSFELTAALLSRCRVLTLRPLGEADLERVLRRALERDGELRALGPKVAPEALAALAQGAFGDARRALNALEAAALAAGPGGAVGEAQALEALAAPPLRHDKSGDSHYDLASALIKSLRGSDPDAALYYCARLLEAGEDPRFVLRRLVIFAAEDVGNADPRALGVAVDALAACELVGMPEGHLPISQAVCYLACAPKSNSALTAYAAARADVEAHGPLPVPLHVRNAPTPLMRELGHGQGYQYPHDAPGHHVAASYLPDALHGRRYYQPSELGEEREIGERLAAWRRAVEAGKKKA